MNVYFGFNWNNLDALFEVNFHDLIYSKINQFLKINRDTLTQRKLEYPHNLSKEGDFLSMNSINYAQILKNDFVVVVFSTDFCGFCFYIIRELKKLGKFSHHS